MIEEIAILAVAIEQGRVQPVEWQRWAERILAKASDSDLGWLVALYDTDNVAGALAALADGARRSSQTAEFGGVKFELGLLMRDWQAGRLSSSELLAKAGAITDSANWDDPPCEAFYLLLNRVEVRPGYEPISEEELRNAIHTLLGGHLTHTIEALKCFGLLI